MRLKIQIVIDGTQDCVKVASIEVLKHIGYVDEDAAGAITRTVVGDKVKLGVIPVLENQDIDCDSKVLLNVE